MRTLLLMIWLLRWFTDIMMNIEIDWETQKEIFMLEAQHMTMKRKVNFIAMRIIGFGLIYDKINNFYIDVKNLVKKYNINKNSLERDEIKLAHAKSSLFGIIKYALNSGYSNVDIKKWYPNYKYDKKDIQGVNSLDVIAKKYDTKSDNFLIIFQKALLVVSIKM